MDSLVTADAVVIEGQLCLAMGTIYPWLWTYFQLIWTVRTSLIPTPLTFECESYKVVHSVTMPVSAMQLIGRSRYPLFHCLIDLKKVPI